MRPIRLNDDELNAVLDAVIGAHGVRSGAKICRLLADSPAWTHRIREVCSVGNVNDIVNKNVNPKIEQLGLVIGCSKPFRLFNAPGRRLKNEHLWSFYRIEAANDDDIDGIDDFDNDPFNPANMALISFATAEEAAAAAAKDAEDDRADMRGTVTSDDIRGIYRTMASFHDELERLKSHDK